MAVTSRHRSPLVPGLPNTLADVLKMLFDAPKGLMQRDDVNVALAREGTEVALPEAPEDGAAFLTGHSGVWVKLVTDAGIKRE